MNGSYELVINLSWNKYFIKTFLIRTLSRSELTFHCIRISKRSERD